MGSMPMSEPERLGYQLEETEGTCRGCGDSATVLVLPNRTFVPTLCDACAELDRKAEDERLAATRAQASAEWLARIGIAPVMQRWTLDSFPTDTAGTRARLAAEAWLEGYRDGERRNLILFGDQGRGKSGLAAALVREVATDMRVKALFVVMHDMLWQLKESFRTNERCDLMSRARSAQVLALDDLGVEPPTSWARSELATLIAHRHQNMAPTIVTSNYDLATLARLLGHDDLMIGKRIVSRLVDNDAVQIRVGGPDRRLGARAA